MSVRRAGSRRSAPASASTRSRSSRSRRGPVRQSTTLRLLRASTRPILDQPDAGGRALRRSSLRGERSVAGPSVFVRAFRLTPATARCLAAGMRDAGRAERARLRQREHFERLADEYAREAAVFDLHSESLFRRFLAVSAPPGRHLLEIGAGAGRYTLPRSWRAVRWPPTPDPWTLVRDYRRGGLRGVSDVMYGAVPIPAVNRWPEHLALEARLNRAPGLRLFSAVQIVRGVGDA